VAEGNYTPKAYHEFIGFEVSKSILERAFARTYSIEMSSIFGSVELAIGSYRHSVATVIPRTTKVAWHLKKNRSKTVILARLERNISTTFHVPGTAKIEETSMRSRISSLV
jgi:hypothetical protein